MIKNIHSHRRTRYRLTLMAFIVLSFMGVWATITKQETIAITVIPVLGGIIGWYTHRESTHPSKKRD